MKTLHVSRVDLERLKNIETSHCSATFTSKHLYISFCCRSIRRFCVFMFPLALGRSPRVTERGGMLANLLVLDFINLMIMFRFDKCW